LKVDEKIVNNVCEERSERELELLFVGQLYAMIHEASQWTPVRVIDSLALDCKRNAGLESLDVGQKVFHIY